MDMSSCLLIGLAAFVPATLKSHVTMVFERDPALDDPILSVAEVA